MLTLSGSDSSFFFSDHHFNGWNLSSSKTHSPISLGFISSLHFSIFRIENRTWKKNGVILMCGLPYSFFSYHHILRLGRIHHGEFTSLHSKGVVDMSSLHPRPWRNWVLDRINWDLMRLFDYADAPRGYHSVGASFALVSSALPTPSRFGCLYT
jgi:hypothetical protein